MSNEQQLNDCNVDISGCGSSNLETGLSTWLPIVLARLDTSNAPVQQLALKMCSLELPRRMLAELWDPGGSMSAQPQPKALMRKSATVESRSPYQMSALRRTCTESGDHMFTSDVGLSEIWHRFENSSDCVGLSVTLHQALSHATVHRQPTDEQLYSAVHNSSFDSPTSTVNR